MIDTKFGRTLKKLRMKKGVSQEDFALSIGLHRTYISQLERGLKSPSLRTIEKICVELNISLVEFMQHLEHKKDP
ncbi:Helix-turn-helix [Desulfotomaculum arcticum]|uniref:Helix-turn-helix n=1 Tax=Desulfotruncus arcticus DSM 17038 TaxID=1121424 RepID=A0A1I2VA00_9FIRM|nr:helix-turn-helix transcriptional regulator [Desulfotruncus arcticus]SFG84226.1 Helix-turn-helix [Desulfotomaculum arcticum] [Desulfotruncus arcticus DSM 17038]